MKDEILMTIAEDSAADIMCMDNRPITKEDVFTLIGYLSTLLLKRIKD
jgi:hypothetical protein